MKYWKNITDVLERWKLSAKAKINVEILEDDVLAYISSHLLMEKTVYDKISIVYFLKNLYIYAEWNMFLGANCTVKFAFIKKQTKPLFQFRSYLFIRIVWII